MIIRDSVPLSSLTTLRVGGCAAYVAECVSEEDIVAALAVAKEKGIPVRVLGEGSNVLALDQGFEGLVLLMRIPEIEFLEGPRDAVVTAGAGVSWDALVRACAERSLWGIENLAGIPGAVGAAPVQNIGAYGMEVSDSIVSVRALNLLTQIIVTLTNEQCGFGYRDSRFKREQDHLILSVSFRVSRSGQANLGYKDLLMLVESGEDMSTPQAIGEAVRLVRSRKFPDLSLVGTAGSFFKNPTISVAAYESLQTTYPDLPGFPNENGVKIPLAYVLDHILGLRGYTEGNVSLYEKQPLVLVTHMGATANEIDSFAKKIAERVYDTIGVTLEREVQMFP